MSPAALLALATFVSAVAIAASAWLLVRKAHAVPAAEPVGVPMRDVGPRPSEQRLSQLIGALAQPREESERSALQRQLWQAGWRGGSDLFTYLASRTLLAVAFPLALSLVLRPSGRLLPLVVALTGVAVGYYLP